MVRKQVDADADLCAPVFQEHRAVDDLLVGCELKDIGDALAVEERWAASFHAVGPPVAARLVAVRLTVPSDELRQRFARKDAPPPHENLPTLDRVQGAPARQDRAAARSGPALLNRSPR